MANHILDSRESGNWCYGSTGRAYLRVSKPVSKYLRCSPLICGADMISVVMRLATTTVYLRLSFLESVGILLHDRFKTNDQVTGERDQSLNLRGEDNENEGEGIQTLERMTWLRWLWFILGTLPPAIKLLSMSSVGWAQAWGVMLLVSWLINKFLIIFATFNQSFFTISRRGRITWPGYEQATRSAKYEKVQRYLNLCEKGLGMTALLVHVVIINNILRIILRLLDTENPLEPVDKYIRPAYVSTVTGAAWIPASLASIPLAIFFGPERSIFAISLSALFFIMLGNIGLSTGSFSSIYVWAISTLTILVDYAACLALILFLCTVGTSLFWYSKMYNPSGTSMPVWTGVFG